MELEKALLTRRSVRKYQKGKTASKDQIKEILKAAMYSPSACNMRPWEFLVIQDEKELENITKLHPYCASLTDAGTAIIVCGDISRQFVAEGEGYFMVDCASATQNILLRAFDLGFATCWCGIYPVKSRMQAFSKHFKLPENIKPFSLILLGTADCKLVQPNDRFEESRIHFEKF